MDYQFIMNVSKMKALSSRHTKMFNKTKAKPLAKIKDYHSVLDDQKARELLTIMAVKSKPKES